MSNNNTKVPFWKSIERVVAILEKSISPEAKVEHDVHMPVIGSPSGSTRQCDVVITFGQHPRQTIAIVEVQKRKRKPEINTFDGWYQKMKDVGAQQLICVSAMGYPKSIIEKVATKIGPTVKLLTLEDLEKANSSSGFFLLPIISKFNRKFKIQNSIIELIGDFIPPPIEIHTKNFSFGNLSECLSANEVVQEILNQTNIDIPAPHELGTKSKPLTILIDDKKHESWFHYFGSKFRIKQWTIKLEIYYEHQQVPIPINNFAYRQQYMDGVLAWISRTKFIFEETEHEIHIVIKPDENGFLSDISFYVDWQSLV
jgi:hypothetical protein